MATILVLHGPNLNYLGLREPTHYGKQTLPELDTMLISSAKKLGYSLFCKQSNAEHELIHFIHDAHNQCIPFIIFNPAAFTHTSIALRDALLAVELPFIEVHLSNIYSREPFRQFSYFSDIATGVITGLGPQGYLLALQAAHTFLLKNEQTGVFH